MKKIFSLTIFLCVFNGISFAEELLYNIKDLLNITVNDKIEIRKSDDSYTRHIQDTLCYYTGDCVIFQQKGLSTESQSALEKYCRIIITTDDNGEGEYPCCDDGGFSVEDLDELKSLAKEELVSGQEFVRYPKVSVESTSKGLKFVRIYYERSGYKGDVCVNMCFYFNYNYAAKMILSYRKSESDIWKSIMNRTINSFTWRDAFTSATNFANYNMEEIKEIGVKELRYQGDSHINDSKKLSSEELEALFNQTRRRGAAAINQYTPSATEYIGLELANQGYGQSQYAETSNEIEHTASNFLIGVIVGVLTMFLFYIVVLSRRK